MSDAFVNDAEAIFRVCVRECTGAFMSGLHFEFLLRALECMLTRVIRIGRTAVWRAVEHNKPSCIEALVKMKADVNINEGCACLTVDGS